MSASQWTTKAIRFGEVELDTKDVLVVGKLYEPELEKISFDDAMKATEQVDDEFREYSRMLIVLGRDVLHLKYVVWRAKEGAQYPFELTERVQAGLFDATASVEQVKPFVALAKKRAKLVPFISTWILSSSGDHAGALEVLDAWVERSTAVESAAIARVLAWERAHGGDSAAIDRLSAK